MPASRKPTCPGTGATPERTGVRIVYRPAPLGVFSGEPVGPPRPVRQTVGLCPYCKHEFALTQAGRLRRHVTRTTYVKDPQGGTTEHNDTQRLPQGDSAGC